MVEHNSEQYTRWLQAQFQAGILDRREFIGKMTALGFSAVFASSFAGRAVAETTAKKGGHMRFGMAHGSTTDTLDPAHVNNGFTTVIHYTITNMLTEVDASGKLVPKLAVSWEPSPDALTWTFELRKGIEFHDGRAFGAKDVLASINYHRGPDSSSAAGPIVEPIESVRADGDHTVVVTLKAGNADFPFQLSTFNFPIYPANDDGSLDWRSGIGVGGYRLKAFEPGVRAVFERNPDFWQAGRAHFDSGELLSIVDTAARQTALITNTVDGIDRIDPKTADMLAAYEGLKVEEVESRLHYTFPMRTDTPPFDDNDVRLALKHAVDREALLKTILFGHGTLGNDHPIGPAYGFYAEDIEQRAYDPDKARHYLKKAGLSELSVTLSAAQAAFSGAVDAAILYKEHARKGGIEIEVVREPNDGYWSNVWMNKPWCAGYWFGTPTADGILTQAYSKGAAWNDTFWDNERFNKLLVQARAELDSTKRQEMYGEMQLLIRDYGGAVIPLLANDVFGIRDNVQHGRLANNYEVDGRLFFERWWFS